MDIINNSIEGFNLINKKTSTKGEQIIKIIVIIILIILLPIIPFIYLTWVSYLKLVQYYNSIIKKF